MNLKSQKAILLLEDGKSFVGVSSGGIKAEAFGKVCFNTGMVGYQQLLTDPCNHDLLVVQTFPLIGNYGINETDFESDKPQAAGLIAREICDAPSNYKCTQSLSDYLIKNNIAAITDIDTRELTRYIRQNGELRGVIATGDYDEKILLEKVKAWHPTKAQPFNADGPTAVFIAKAWHPTKAKPFNADGPTAMFIANPICQLTVLDFGSTRSGIEALAKNKAALSVLSGDSDIQDITDNMPDGVILSNGGGNPNTDYKKEIELIKQIVKLKLPILGIGLGHQLLALANGMTVSELKCGHRGANQPVYSNENGRTYITSQNHCYIVDRESINAHDNVTVTYENSNDHTVEGLCYENCTSVQFIPDADDAKQSTAFIYENFFEKVAAKKGKVD